MSDLQDMMGAIELEVRDTRRLTGRASLSPRVMAALRAVPRHRFVPDDLQAHAYDNRPLPIGLGQTISQPYMVALMTDLLDLHAENCILEVGTGSGYQAAVLAQLVARVHSTEIVAELGEQARRRLTALGFDNVEVHISDGGHGWPAAAPYDGIMVTAATPVVPAPLLAQLKPGGRLVIPVGHPHAGQDLQLWQQDAHGDWHPRSILPVAFVPLTGDHRNAN